MISMEAWSVCKAAALAFLEHELVDMGNLTVTD
jgi:hypothetical protein